MENDRNYYQGILDVIDYLLNVNRILKREDGIRLTGNYWTPIVDVFRNNPGTYIMSVETIGLKENHQSILALREQCLNRIKEIEKAEYDRELSNRESEENIKYGRKGYRISIVAIWLSALAILVEIIRGILDLLL